MNVTLDYAGARDAARRARRGDPIYPRLYILGGEWVRQDREGGPITVVTQHEAEAAMLIRLRDAGEAAPVEGAA